MFIRTPVDLGAVIRDRRRRLGLNQGRLADRAGVSRQWIVEVEKGKPRAELGLVLRTLDALGIALAVGDGTLAGNQDIAHAVDIDAVVAAARKNKNE